MDISKSSTVRELNITNRPSTSDFMASPHGMDIWKDPKTGQLTLYVITHQPAEDRIEVFELIGQSELKYIRTITDHNFKTMNDLVAVGKDQFYITHWLYFRDLAYNLIEYLLFLHMGKVFYYDGGRATEVASGLFAPNGINISPDKTTVYVAEFGNKRLVGYQRKPNNDLTKIWEYDMGTGVDNIVVDSDTGDLWIGCHPLFYYTMDLLGFFEHPFPSQVLKVKMNQNSVSKVIEVYADLDGSEVSGSAVAIYVMGKLIVGTVKNQAIACDAKYVE